MEINKCHPVDIVGLENSQINNQFGKWEQNFLPKRSNSYKKMVLMELDIVIIEIYQVN
jgi:hypothetical protein